MEQNSNSHPSRFTSLRTTAPAPTTWTAVFQELTNGTHAHATLLYRETDLALHHAERMEDQPKTRELKERKSRIKQSQPAIVVSVTLEGGRTLSNVTGYTGFILVDIDNIPAEHFEGTLLRVREDPHSFLVHTTISGRGIRVFARVEGPLDKRLFPIAWRAVNDHYANLTGIAIDDQCKNATRMSVLCHDPNALFRPDAIAFPSPRIASERPTRRPGKSVSAKRAAKTVRQLVEQDGAAYEPHRHNDYISRCLYWMNRFGVSLEDAEGWALETFADYDAHAIRSAAKSCYALTAEHDTKRLRDFERKERGNRPSFRVSVDEMENYIQDRLEIRRNLMINQLEFRRKGETEWERLSDTTENSLWRAMQKDGLDVDIFRLRTLLGSDFTPDFHPLSAYLESLPAWDEVSDPIGELASRVHVAHEEQVEFTEGFRRWLVGLLAGALDKGVVNQLILVLIGPQGCYKTSFMQNLLPPVLRRYYATKANSQRLTKDDLLTVTEKLLINFEEIDTMRPADLNQIKAMTTALYIDERPAYGRNKVHLPHVASFCATGNNPFFLSDDTGNRRWLVFEVTGIESPWTHPIDHDAVYAQAKALLDSGFRYWYRDGEIDSLNQRNRRFETPNLARELILTYYRKPQGMEVGKYFTASQIVARFGGGSVRLSTALVGRALKELGFQNYHTRHGNFWVMMERPVEEVNRQLPEAIQD